MAAHVQDMTEGVPLRKIVSFGIPILLGTLFQQLYGLVDTMVVGYTLGIAVITAHTASRRVLELLSQPLGSLCAAFSVFTAQTTAAGSPPGSVWRFGRCCWVPAGASSPPSLCASSEEAPSGLSAEPRIPRYLRTPFCVCGLLFPSIPCWARCSA